MTANALHGQGISNLCNEIDAIDQLYQGLKVKNKILFGDEAFGTEDENLKDDLESLNSLRIYNFTNLYFMKRYFRNDSYKKLNKESSHLLNTLVQSLPKFR